MLVPWLLYWCLNLVKRKQVSFSLIPVIVLLVFAHSAIALTCLFALAIALLAFVAAVGFKGLRAVLWRLGICCVATALLLAPLLWCNSIQRCLRSSVKERGGSSGVI